jgi:hypothetical protein
LTAVVSADAGVTATVTWTTTNSAIATVSQAGLVSSPAGGASGTVGICAAASATGLTTVSNCAQVVVQPPTTVVPAVLQIASVTGAGGLNIPVPVPPGATIGQINVSVTVNPGTEKMDSVVVTLNGVGAATQTFTSAQAAIMRSVANDLSAQALITSLVFSINTGAFNPLTGAVTYLNGAYTIAVVGYGHQGTTAAVNSSTNTWPLLFANPDGWIMGQTLGAGFHTAVNAAGYNYVGGVTASLSVTAIPVLYSGLVISTTAPLLPVVGFGTGVCGASVRSQAMTAPVAPSHAFTATFARTATGTAHTADVNNYEFQWATGGACAAGGFNNIGGETSGILSAWYTNNTNVPGNPTLIGAGFIRLDNQAPTGFGIVSNVNNRTNNWFNDAVLLNVPTATTNGIVTAGTDLGSGGPIVYTSTVGGVGMNTTSTLAETGTNAAYTVSVTATDLLGNVTAASTETFGVDRTPPTLAAINQPKAPGNLTPALGSANAAFTADPATGFAFVANDPTGVGGVTGSGFFNLAGAPVTMSESARNATSTTWWCNTNAAYQLSTVACPAGGGFSGWVSGTNFLSNLVIGDHGIGNNYFLTTASIADQAGNSSSPSAVQTIAGTGPFTTNLFAVDAVAVQSLGNLDPPLTFPTSNSSYGFTFGAATTGLDLALARLGWAYNGGFNDAVTNAAFANAGGNVALFWAPDVTIDAFNAATLQTTATASVTVSNMLTNFEITSGLGVNGAALNANQPLIYTYETTNQPGNITSNTWGLVGTAYTVPAAAMTNGGGLNQGPAQWYICGTATSAAPCGVTPALLTAGNVTVSRATGTPVVITAVAAGTTAVFNNPYSQVQFWAYSPSIAPPAAAPSGWRLIGIANNSSNVTDGLAAVPGGRNWQFTATFVPSAAYAPDNAVYHVVAIGIGAGSLTTGSGVALATPVGGTTITVTP